MASRTLHRWDRGDNARRRGCAEHCPRRDRRARDLEPLLHAGRGGGDGVGRADGRPDRVSPRRAVRGRAWGPPGGSWSGCTGRTDHTTRSPFNRAAGRDRPSSVGDGRRTGQEALGLASEVSALLPLHGSENTLVERPDGDINRRPEPEASAAPRGVGPASRACASRGIPPSRPRHRQGHAAVYWNGGGARRRLLI